ncbi:MAG: lysostaphin resistance A-like protein, partial [Candidatus Rokuibacteriota bacterium]
LWRLRALAALELALVLGGGAAAGVLLTRRRRQTAAPRIGDAVVPPPWPFGRGVVVLVRGGAAGALVAVALFVAYQFIDHPVDELLAVPMTYLPFVPVVLLAARHLAAPAGLTLAGALGLRVPAGRWRQALLVAVLLCAAGILGEWLLVLLGEWRGVDSHWTEWFDRDLVWGTPLVTAMAILGAVVVAPVMEEIVFRGLVFGTLRRRLPWPAAALASATLFALAHGYGALGFAAVLWSGAVWAYAYERTGSLWPGILAHAANNAAATLTVIWLLRL